MKKLIKKEQKGFTLVEVIVVLVILALMAAVLIPSLVGYINKARENTIIADTRSAVLATQTLASENYAKDKTITSVTVTTNATGVTTGVLNIAKADILDLAELDGTYDADNFDVITFTDVIKVSNATLTGGGRTCTYNGSTYTVS